MIFRTDKHQPLFRSFAEATLTAIGCFVLFIGANEFLDLPEIIKEKDILFSAIGFASTLFVNTQKEREELDQKHEKQRFHLLERIEILERQSSSDRSEIETIKYRLDQEVKRLEDIFDLSNHDVYLCVLTDMIALRDEIKNNIVIIPDSTYEILNATEQRNVVAAVAIEKYLKKNAGEDDPERTKI